MLGDVGCLADVGEQETWEAVTQPTQLDGTHAEGTQIGEKSLDTSEGKQDAAQALPAVSLCSDEVLKGVCRIEGLEDRVVKLCEIVDAEDGVKGEPDDDDGGKGAGNLGNAQRLDEEEEDEDAAGGANNGRLVDVGNDDLEPLDGTENTLGRGKDAVTHDHGDGKDSDCFQQPSRKATLLKDGTNGLAGCAEFSGAVTLHADERRLSRIAVRNVCLYKHVSVGG